MPKTLRSCIVAEPGYTFIAADASQIELRVMAILSQDPNMLADLATGDLHAATAIRMYGKPTEEDALEHLPDGASDEEIQKWIADEFKKRRYKAKTGNFATVYGAGAFQLATTFECSEEEAQQFLDDHKAAYPRLYIWMDDVKRQAKSDGFVKSIFGRIRYLPEINDASLPWKIREKAEKEAVNTIVQGTAVDIVKKMMLYMRSILDGRDRLVLNVHDEMVWECPDQLLNESISQFAELKMAFPDYPVKVSVGKVYGEVKEIKEEN